MTTKSLFLVCLLYFCYTQATLTQQLIWFPLDDLQHNTTQLEDVKGNKFTIIDFWATWCKPCVKALASLNDIHKDYKSQGVSVVGIACDGPRSIAKVNPLVKSMSIEYPILTDIDTKIFNANNFSVYPTLVIINSQNQIVYHQSGYNSKLHKKLHNKIEELLKL